MPRHLAEQFGEGDSHLERYASRLKAVEINSSFYRSHRRSTYERWAASVPEEFRFAVKLPRSITHERRLVDCDDLIRMFADEVAGLGCKRGPILVQLPPSLAFAGGAAHRFFETLGEMLGGPIVCEPRHPSWFEKAADDLLVGMRVSRVAADPAVVSGGEEPGGWRDLEYFRFHGSPRIYRSEYSSAAIDRHAETVRQSLANGREVWTIFDNTAAGHAPANALSLARTLGD